MTTQTQETDQSLFFKGFMMWLCASLFYGFQFLIRVSPGAMKGDLMATFATDECLLSTTLSMYYWGYSFMQIPAGILLDQIGPRHPLTWACFLCGVGCMIFANGGDMTALGIGRFLLGVGSAFGFLSCVRVASTWFPASKLTLFVGLSIVIGTTGANAGGYPLAYLVTEFGWQHATHILAGTSVVLGILSWAIVRERETVKHAKETFAVIVTRVLAGLSSIVTNPQTWVYGLYGFMMYVPLSGFADLHGTAYTMQVFGVSREVAAGATMTLYIGLGCGSPVWALLPEKMNSYSRPMLISGLMTLPFVLLMIYLPNVPFTAVYFLYFLIGFMAAGQFLAFGAITELNSQKRAATASGMHNMLCMFSGILAQPVMGFILDTVWDNTTAADGTRIYSMADYQWTLATLPIALLIAIASIFFMKDSFGVAAENEGGAEAAA